MGCLTKTWPFTFLTEREIFLFLFNDKEKKASTFLAKDTEQKEHFLSVAAKETENRCGAIVKEKEELIVLIAIEEKEKTMITQATCVKMSTASSKRKRSIDSHSQAHENDHIHHEANPQYKFKKKLTLTFDMNQTIFFILENV